MTSDSTADARCRMNTFETLLDGSRDALDKHVDMNMLRALCARSIPDSPPHIRPRAYDLLLGTLPSQKRSWKAATRSQRDKYYALVRRYMDELEDAEWPQSKLSPDDALLLRISKDVERLDLPVLRARTSPTRSSPIGPRVTPSPDGSEADDSQSSSAGEENETRSSPASKRKASARVPHIDSRRALFSRLARIERRHEPQPTAKGKEKEVSPPPPPALPSPALLSPLSPNSDADGVRTPSLSLTIPQELDASEPPSPITLLSPQLVTGEGNGPHAPDNLPDTHGEALTRLMYVFARTNPQWAYGPTFVDIAVPLYLVYCEANVSKSQRDGSARHAEEETFWAFTSLMRELGDVVAGVPGDSVMSSALRRVSARVRWADEPLWTRLHEYNLDPGLPLYTFQWLSGLLSQDRSNLLPVWDFLFAQPAANPQVNPKLDLLLDLCVALVVLVKPQIMFAPTKPLPPSPKRDLWHGADHMEIPGEPEDPDAAFVRCLQLFRHYPLQEVGGVWMLLNTAFELNQARRQSMVEGIDPDSPAWTATQDAAAHKANWTANKLRESTGKLWSSYAESDVTARMANMAKASSTFTASAVAKWSASAPATPDWKGLGAAAGRLFSRKPRTSTGSVSGEEYEFHSGPTSPASTYQPGPHSPITPSHSTNPSYGGGLGLVTRGRSDSVQSRSSAVSVGSLQERLSGLASGLTTPREPTQRVTSGPRPLLLSGSARKAQHAPPSPRPRGGSSTGITGGLASPPHHDGGHAGLYRIGSRRGPNGARKGNRQSLGSDYSAPYDSDHSHGSFAQGGLALSAMDRALPAAVPENAIPSPLPSPTPQSASLETPEAPEPISIPTPQISHLTEDDYEHVYEPAEDSFILLDALEADALVLRDAKPALCVEIGSGSGIASTFMGTLLGTGEAFMLSTDINAYAAAATLRTGDANDVTLNPVLANLLDPLESRIAGQIDLLIFNPPYVVTDDDELVATQNGRDIGGAWAGGNLGMAVTDILLERLPTLLAPGGRFYLVAIHQNKPDEIIARMRAAGLECKTVIKRRAGRELLSVIRMIAPGDSRGATPRSSPEASPVPAIQSPLAYTSFTAAAGAGAESASAADPVPAPAPAQVAVKKTEAPQTPPVQTVATPADSETDAGEEEEDYGALLDAYA